MGVGRCGNGCGNARLGRYEGGFEKGRTERLRAWMMEYGRW